MAEPRVAVAEALAVEFAENEGVTAAEATSVALGALGLPLAPHENMALTVALTQVRRGDPVTDNVAATCALALARIARGES